MIRFTKLLMKDPKLVYNGIKGYLMQPLTPSILYKMVQFLMIESKTIKLKPWAKTGAFTAAFPIEFGLAFDLFPNHPEAYGACTGAAKSGLVPIQHSEELGYSSDLCSYMRMSIGASRLKWPEDFGGYEPPDAYFSANPVCDTHMKWLEGEAKIFGKPHFGLDIPSYVAGDTEERLEEYIDYVEAQFHDLIRFLEDLTKKKFNEEKFLDVLDDSKEACRLYLEIFKYRLRYPANMYFERQRLFMLPVVVMWDLKGAVKFYQKWLKKAQKRYGDRTVIEGGREKYRIMWEGITIWHRVDLLTDVLGSKGAKVVYEPYTESFGLRKTWERRPLKETLRQIAREHIILPYTLNLDERIRYFDKKIGEYDLDGVILFANQSCRPQSTGLQDLQESLHKKWGIPVMMLNADHCDPRKYAEGPISTRVDGFIEMMDRYKAKKGKKDLGLLAANAR